MKRLTFTEARALQCAGPFSFRLDDSGSSWTVLVPSIQCYDERLFVISALVEASESGRLSAVMYV